MIRIKEKYISLFFVFLVSACSVIETSSNQEKRNVSYKFHGGVSRGGIIENTDMDLVENAGVDAFSGATQVGASFGGHTEILLRSNSIETGIDLFLDNQTFTYNDLSNNYFGDRNILTTQLRIPLSYNFFFFNNEKRNNWFQLKLGLSAGYSSFSVDDETNTLPDYEIKHFTLGPLLGFDILPWQLSNNSQIGFHLELSRSFQQVYYDYYNVGKMPGQSYFKFGVTYRLPSKPDKE